MNNEDAIMFTEHRTQNTESFFARLKAKLKEYALIYYPVHYTKSALRIAKSFTKWQLYKHTVKFNRDGLNVTEQRPRKIIASLTSYPARINVVPYVIASLLKQTMKPDKIILWLAESQFPDKNLPPLFDEVKSCGVDVNFCPDDLKPHKKYFYTMQEYPEDIVITFDDDFIYDKHIIETLYKSYTEHPDCVSAMRVHKIVFNSDGMIADYNDWEEEYSGARGRESHSYLATNGAGALFPPYFLHEEAFNTESIKKLCPRADDVWLKFMEIMNGTKVVPASDTGKVPGWSIFGTQEFALWKTNTKNGGNDTQIRALLDAYSDWRDSQGRTLLEVIRED